MDIKTEFKPNKLYLSLLNNIKKIKTTEHDVTPYDVVIASTWDIGAVADHYGCNIYKK